MSREEERLAELKQWLAIPSVSSDPQRAPEVRRAAEWICSRMERAGITARVLETAGHPVVVGERAVGPGLPTVLVYGHYDVQPEDPIDEWVTPPFEPTVRDGNLYARGSSDDKGQVLAQLLGAEELIASEQLGVNLKFLIEGEEEVGSPSLDDFIAANQELLGCDVVVISDGAMFSADVPTVTTGLRGLTYLEIHVTGASKDLHSGAFGGAVANPLNALATIIARLKDEQGRILVPGLYDKVRSIADDELEGWRRLPFDEARFAAGVGVGELPGEQGFSVLERLWARPTLDVNGIWGGFQGEGSKTVLPAKAGAKVSLRLVPDQDTEEVFNLVRDYVTSIAPRGVKVEVRKLHGGQPVALDPREPVVQAAMRALGTVFPGKKPALTRSGGSIPIVANFRERLGAPVLLVDMGLPDDGAHGPNEKLALASFSSGVDIAREVLRELSASLAK